MYLKVRREWYEVVERPRSKTQRALTFMKAKRLAEIFTKHSSIVKNRFRERMEWLMRYFGSSEAWGNVYTKLGTCFLQISPWAEPSRRTINLKKTKAYVMIALPSSVSSINERKCGSPPCPRLIKHQLNTWTRHFSYQSTTSLEVRSFTSHYKFLLLFYHFTGPWILEISYVSPFLPFLFLKLSWKDTSSLTFREYERGLSNPGSRV